MWAQKNYKHEPSFLSEHTDRVHSLIGINMIVYGPDPSSVGYVVSCAMERFLENNVDQVPSWEYKTYVLDNDKHTNINVLVRQCYMYFELVIQDYGNNDRYLIKYVINNISKTMGINTNGELCNKLIVLHNIDSLSPESLQMLAVFVEKHVSGSRFLFTTKNYNKLCNRLKSQSVFVRIPVSSDDVLCNHIQKIVTIEGQEAHHTKKTIFDIIHNNEHHMESCMNDIQLQNKSSETVLFEEIVQTIKRSKGNLSVIKKLRNLVYVLLVNDKSGSYIVKKVTNRLLKEKKATIQQQMNVVQKAAMYEHRSCLSERYVYHLEAFFMSIL